MKTYQIWTEGYESSGELGPPKLLDVTFGGPEPLPSDAFDTACRFLLGKDVGFDDSGPRPVFWGCRLYPTYEEALAVTEERRGKKP